MEYNWIDPEKMKSNIKILERIAESKGFSGNIADYVSGFLAERIEMVDGYYVCYSRLKKGITRLVNLADHLIEGNPDAASIFYINAGKNALGLSGKLNDEKYVKLSEKCFSSLAKFYKKMAENLDKENEDKKEEYESLSKEYKFLSNNAFKLKEIISDYYKLQKRTNDLINKVNFKAPIHIPNLVDKILDNLNNLKKLDPNSIEAQKIKIKINEDAIYLPKESYAKIKSLTNKISSNYKN